MGDEFDGCECIWSHEMAMQRLINFVSCHIHPHKYILYIYIYMFYSPLFNSHIPRFAKIRMLARTLSASMVSNCRIRVTYLKVA